MKDEEAFVMTPARQASLAKWLDLSRRLPPPIEDFAGTRLPVREFNEAAKRGLFGIRPSDHQRILDEMAARARK